MLEKATDLILKRQVEVGGNGTVITRKVREVIKHRRKLFLYYGQN